MDLQLNDKLALVTGSTAGIGNAVAYALAREGARVIVNGRGPESVDAAVNDIKERTGNDNVYGYAGDMSDTATAETVAIHYPKVDILVNNLGIFEPKPFEQIPDEEWIRFFKRLLEHV